MTRSNPRVAGKASLAVVAVASIATSKAPPVPPANVPMWSIASQPLALPCGTADVWVSKSGKTGLGITVRIAPTGSGQAGLSARPARVAVDPEALPPSPNGTPIAADLAQDPAGPGIPEPTTPVGSSAPGCPASIHAALRFSDRTFTGTLVAQKHRSELQADGRQQVSRAELDRVPSPGDETYYYLAFELDNEERWNRGDRAAILELGIEVGGHTQVWSMPATHADREWPADGR